MADTGPLFALADRRDQWHVRAREWWQGHAASLTVPATVLTEAAWLIGDRLGPDAETAFVRGFVGGSQYLESLDDADLERAAELMSKYESLPLGLVDASIVALAERLDVTHIFTTDRKHFGVVRPAHCKRLTLVP